MRTWILLAIAAAGAATAYLCLDRSAVSTESAVGGGSTQNAGHGGPSPRVTDPARWAPGLHRECTLSFGTTISGDPPATIALEGRWRTTVVDEAGQRPVVRVELARPRASLGSTAAPSSMLHELGLPWFLELDSSGRIEAAWFEPGVGREARDLLKSVASYLQPAPAGEPILERDERDATGTYRARYERPAPGQLTRVKERYLDVMTGDGPMDPEDLGGPRVDRPRRSSSTPGPRSTARSWAAPRSRSWSRRSAPRPTSTARRPSSAGSARSSRWSRPRRPGPLTSWPAAAWRRAAR